MGRYNSRLRGLQRLFLIQRDGNKCKICGIDGYPAPILRADGCYVKPNEAQAFLESVCVEENRPYAYLDVEHVDQSDRLKTRNNPNDLRLLCHSCNQKVFNEWKRGQSKLRSGQPSIYEKEVVNEGESVVEGRSPSTKPIIRSEVLRRAWGQYLTLMLEEGHCGVDAICNSFRPFISKVYDRPFGSAATAARYLDEETSVYGDLVLVDGESVRFRSAEVRNRWRAEFLGKTPVLEPTVVSEPKSIEEALKQVQEAQRS